MLDPTHGPIAWLWVGYMLAMQIELSATQINTPFVVYSHVTPSTCSNDLYRRLSHAPIPLFSVDDVSLDNLSTPFIS